MLLYLKSQSKIEKRSLENSGCTKNSVDYNYVKSQELGTNCYTTAELSADLVKEDYTFNIGDGEIYGRFHNVPLQPGVVYNVHPAVKADLPVNS